MLATPVQGLQPDPIIDVTISSQKADPDRVLRIQQAHDFPHRVLWLMACFTALVALCHLLTMLSTMLFSRRSSKPEGARSRALVRRIPAALVDTFRVVAFRSTIPIGGSYSLNLAEVFLTAGYITVIFVICPPATNSKGMIYDPKYWANTAGNVAASQLSVVTALGTRNNVLSWLTGISFDKFNYLHRVSARALCILAWVHGAGRMMLGMTGTVAWSHPYIQAGLLAAVAFSILSIISVRPIRDAGYEFFLIMHFLLAFITVLAAYFHAQEFELGYYVWPAFVIWGLDRLIQLGRTVVLNAMYLKRVQSPHELDAKVEVLSPQFLRLTLHRPNFFRWRPGQSAFLTVPTVSTLPFETHPFTISTIDESASSGDAASGTSSPDSDRGEKGIDSDSQSTVSGKELSFLIRVRRGFTQRLLNAAGKDQSLKVLIDGPYGSPPWLKGFDAVVLIAGGSGVAFTLPILLDLIRRAKMGLRKSECRKVSFVWAIKELDHIRWIADALEPAIRDVQSSLIVEIRIFVTGSAGGERPFDDDSVHSDPECEKGRLGPQGQRCQRLLKSSLVRVENGRPDLQALLENETQKATGSMSVNVCGTHALTGAVRAALRKPRFMDILRGGPSVTLHVEAFGSY